MKLSQFAYFASMMLILIQTIQISLVASENGYLSEDCKKMGFDTELQLKNLFFMSRKSVPKELDEFQNYCKDAKEVLKLLRMFKRSNCFNQAVKTLLNVLYPQFSKTIKNVCDVKHDETFKTFGCMNQQDIDLIKSCMNDFSLHAKWISLYEKDDKKMFSSICCGYRKIQLCFDKITDQCTKEVRNPRIFWHNIIESIMTGLEQLVCPRYDMSYCLKEKYFERLNKQKSQENPKEFIIMPIVNIGRRFTEDNV